MKKSGLSILIIVLIVLTCLSGYQAWRDSQRASIVLDWTTASEIDTVGFNIYRSEQPNQGYSQMNAEIIPASQEPLTGGEYSFLDADVKPGRVYYYQLEDVSMDGQASRNGPIEVKARADYSTTVLYLVIMGGATAILRLYYGCKNKEVKYS